MKTKKRLLIHGLLVVVLLTICFLFLEDLDSPNQLQISSAIIASHQLPSNSDLIPELITSQDVIAGKIHKKEQKLAGENFNKPQNPSGRTAWEFAMRTSEDGTIPDGALMRAKEQFDLLEKLRPVGGDKDCGIEEWEWLGPGNIGGRIRAIAINPTNPNIMYIGGVAGGVWKTTDGGEGWNPLTDFLPNLAITFLVMDPNDPNTIYASTGEGFGNGDRLRGAGIFKTTTGGIIWNQLTSTTGADFHWVNRLAHHPTNSDHLLAATRSGLWETLDGGVTWANILSPIGSTLDVRFHPLDANLILVGTNSDAYFSADGGGSFNRITDGATSTLDSPGRCEVAFAPSDVSVFYIAVNINKGEIWRSSDGGTTWNLRNTGTEYMKTQGWYDNAIWVRPDDPDYIIVGGIDLWRSTDGGPTLAKISRWQNYHSGDFSAHADQHIIVAHPNFGVGDNRIVYFGNDGGIQFQEDINYADWFTGWVNLANNLGITQFYGGAAAPDGSVIVGGTQDNSHLRYRPDGGVQWWYQATSGDGGFAAVNYNNPLHIYSEYVYLEIFKSTDGGTNYTSMTTGLTDSGDDSTALFIAPFVIDPVNPEILYAGGSSIWRTLDGAGTWSQLKVPEAGNPLCSTIDVAPSNPNVIWVGYENGVVMMSDDAGGTWTRVDDNIDSIPARYITDISISPHNFDQVVVTVGGYQTDTVWYTADGGGTWTLINGTAPNDLPAIQVNTVRFDPVMENWIFIGTDLGVLATEDLGQNWSVTAWRGENEGPLNTRISELFWMSGQLIAATHGRGMFVAEPFRNHPPVTICQDVVMDADEDCLEHVTAEMVDNGSYDPDGDAIVFELDPPGPFDLGETNVTLTVTDEHDASGSCEAIVTVVDTTPPVVTCSDNIEIECTQSSGVSASDPQLADFFDGFVAEDNCDDDLDIINDAPPFFNGPCESSGGATLVTWTATDDAGNMAQCSTTVTVIDTTPPEIEVTASPEVLWPPNHKMVDVDYTVTVSDICDDSPVWELVSITSNEPDDAHGSGSTEPDIMGADTGTADTTASLRSERNGGGTGRIYQATFMATDCSGNTAMTITNVHVPHSPSDIGTILSNANGLDSGLNEVSYMVSGASLWPMDVPVEYTEGADGVNEQPTIDPLEGNPLSAFITNTAGVVPTSAFLVNDVDNDDHPDILMAFDRRALIALERESQELDGDPVMVLEIRDEEFLVLDMSDIQRVALNLNAIIEKLQDGERDDELKLVSEDDIVIVQAVGIVSTAPNPFNPQTTISYYVPKDEYVELVVFDISGRMINRLVTETIVAGEHSVVWMGDDRHGSRVASGVYFFRMQAGGVVDIKRAVMIK